MRLFYKFLIVFLLVALAPLSWAGWKLLRETEDSLRATSHAIQTGMAARSAERLRHRLDEIQGTLSAFQANPALLAQDKTQPLRALLRLEPAILDAAVYDALGREAAFLSRPGRARKPLMSEWGPAREDLVTKGSHWAPPSFAPGDRPSVTVGAALGPSPGRITGTLAVRLDLGEIGGALKGPESGPEGLAFVLSPEGRMVAHSSEEDLYREEDALGLAAFSSGWKEGVYTGLLGKRVLGVKVPVPGTDWTLYLERPTGVAFDVLMAVRRRLLASLLLAGALAAALCFFMTRLLVRPLVELRAAVGKMKTGDFSALIPQRSRDELGELAGEIREAQAALEKKTRDAVLGKMSRLISHDLRVPLQAISGALTALKKYVSDERGLKQIAILEAAAEDAGEFAEEMLAVGRDQELILRPAQVNDMVRAALETWRTKEGVALDLRLGEGLPRAHMDDKAAVRALTNLLKNAQDAVDAEKGRVEVRTEAEDGYVCLTVADNGCGIPPEKRKRMFEEFTTKSGGSGLGLLVVKKVMDLHRGEIRIESEINRGTAVTLRFPASKSPL